MKLNNLSVKITIWHLQLRHINKIHAIKCYLSELERVNYSWIEMVKNRDRLNGLKNNTEYAESFYCVKCLLNNF